MHREQSPSKLLFTSTPTASKLLYMRSDLFEQRRELMEAWGDNLAQTERAGSG